MIFGYIGNMGNGKTLGAVKELYKYYLKGYKIYSNTHLKFRYTVLTLDFIMKLAENKATVPDNCVFFIDEIHIWIDSRVSGSKKNRMMSYFLLQTRKMGNDNDCGLVLLYTTQFIHQIDRRLRSVTDIVTECTKIKTRNKKIFMQEVYIFKGKKSYSYKRILHKPELFYNLYDTRKKIAVEE